MPVSHSFADHIRDREAEIARAWQEGTMVRIAGPQQPERVTTLWFWPFKAVLKQWPGGRWRFTLRII